MALVLCMDLCAKRAMKGNPEDQELETKYTGW